MPLATGKYIYQGADGAEFVSESKRKRLACDKVAIQGFFCIFFFGFVKVTAALGVRQGRHAGCSFTGIVIKK